MENTVEEWRDVVGYEGIYQVSNLGHIKSLDRMVNSSYGSKMVIKGRMISPIDNGKGYKCVSLCKDGKIRRTYIHHIVAQAFIANPDGYSEVNHKDEDKSNNRVDNLEWCTRRYNCNYGNRNDLCSKTYVHPKRKVMRLETGVIYESMSDAARMTGESISAIYGKCKGRIKNNNGAGWKYCD